MSGSALILDPETVRAAVALAYGFREPPPWPVPEGGGWGCWQFHEHDTARVGPAFARAVASLFPSPPQEKGQEHGEEGRGGRTRHVIAVNWESLDQRALLQATDTGVVNLLSRRISAQLVAERDATELEGGEWARRLSTAAAFLYPPDSPTDDVILLGRPGEVLHISGEATIACSMTGVGKSSVGQNYALHRLRFDGFDGTFLGFPVHPLGEGEAILYVAADRPKQIARSLRRMVPAELVELLEKRLIPWWGPLPFRLNDDPLALARFAQGVGRLEGVRVVEVILDSLKDVARELHKPEGADAAALAIKTTVAEGIDVLALHHDRKVERGSKRRAATVSIDDVYGGMNLVAGAGNVWYLLGPPSARDFRLLHLKPSVEEVGPLEVAHDHRSGLVTLGSPVRRSGIWRPTGIMEKVSKFLEDATEPLAGKRIEAGVGGTGKTVRAATDRLVAEAFVQRWKEGNAQLHESVRPYRQADDPYDEHGEPREPRVTYEVELVEDDEGAEDDEGNAAAGQEGG